MHTEDGFNYLNISKLTTITYWLTFINYTFAPSWNLPPHYLTNTPSSHATQSKKFSVTYNRCETLNLQSLEQRRKIMDLTLLHSILIGETEISPDNYPYKIIPNRRRPNHIFPHPFCRTSIRNKSFFIRTKRQYNLIPIELQQCKDIKIFRKLITIYLKNCIDE